jgi:hypothetical protein
VAGFGDLPAAAAWRHLDARAGFEVVFFRAVTTGHRIEGSTAAVEDGRAWTVAYRIDTDSEGVTRSAHVTSLAADGMLQVRLVHDGQGRWLRDGRPAPHLDGCQDVDLESSAVTNSLPVRRLRLTAGARAGAEAAYVRALDLAVERLEQAYARVDDDRGQHQRYDYSAPRFDFSAQLVYDESGLVTDYPGLASRVPRVRPG